MNTERWRVLGTPKRLFHLDTSEGIEASQGPCLHGWSHILTSLRRIEWFQWEIDANDDLHYGLQRQSRMGSRWDQVDVLGQMVLGRAGSAEQKEGRQRWCHLSPAVVVLSRQERVELITVDRAIGSKGYLPSANWKQWKFSPRSDPRDQKDWHLGSEDTYQLCRCRHVGLKSLESNTYFLRMLNKSQQQGFLLTYLKGSCKLNICCVPEWLNDSEFDPNYNSV